MVFAGLLVHHDADLGYALLVPVDWHRLELSGSPTGVFYAPDPNDLLTGLAIEARDLGTSVSTSDLPALRRGLLSGLRSLAQCQIEHHEAEAVGDLLTLEARCVYSDDEAVRKRWVRLLYRGRVQVRLVAQAASVDAFAQWEPLFFEAMRTIHFGDGLF